MSNLKVKLADSLNNDWKKVLNSSLTSPYFSELCSFLTLEYDQKDIFPLVTITDFDKNED